MILECECKVITKNNVKVTLFVPAINQTDNVAPGKTIAKTVCEFHFSDITESEMFVPGKSYNISPTEITLDSTR